MEYQSTSYHENENGKPTNNQLTYQQTYKQPTYKSANLQTTNLHISKPTNNQLTYQQTDVPANQQVSKHTNQLTYKSAN